MTSEIERALSAENPLFAESVRAVITGNTSLLDTLLTATPALIPMRSVSDHHATLLHYLAANGVADVLQVSPSNAVEIAEVLFAHGAKADEICDAYGTKYATTMDLLVSSIHPASAGVQGALVRTLLAHGAKVDGITGDGSPMRTALLFGYPECVRVLSEHGAQSDNIVFAAATGRTDLLSKMLAHGLMPLERRCTYFPISSDPDVARQQALVFASMCDQIESIELLVKAGADIDAIPPGSHVTATPMHTAAYQGNVRAIKCLLSHGARTTILDPRYKSTAKGWAEHAGREEAVALLLE